MRALIGLVAVLVVVTGCNPAASSSFGAPSSRPTASGGPQATPSGVVPSLAPSAPRSIAPSLEPGRPLDEYAWQPTTLVTDQQTLIFDVAATPAGWIAVGVRMNLFDTEASLAPDVDPLANLYSGVVWTSTDGSTWTQAADSPAFRGARMTKVIGTSTEVLVFGLGGICLPDACGGLPPNGGTIVWSSPDGVDWARHDDTSLASGAVVDVAGSDGWLIAVGFAANDGSKPDDDQFSDPTDAAVWRSRDGRDWQRVSRLPVADTLSRVSAHGRDVIATGESAESTVSWVSHDAGGTWSAAGSVSGCCPVAATADGRAIVVSSMDADTHLNGAVFVGEAATGRWAQTFPEDMRGFRPASVQVLADSFVVSGWTVHRDDDGLLVDDRPLSFATTDGSNWSRPSLPDAWGGKFVSAADRGGDVIVAVLGPLETLNGPSDDLRETIWVGTAR